MLVDKIMDGIRKNVIQSLCLLCFILLTNSNISAQCWAEVFSDDFTSSSIDQSKWNIITGNGCPNLCGWGNNEKEYYTDTTLKLAGGNLNITAYNTPNYKGSGSNFISGKITTLNKFNFLYGKVEARIKLPSGIGMWPAFWMLPSQNTYGNWPTSGEIDIMENRGDQPGMVTGTLHYGNSYPNNEYDYTDYNLSSGNFTNSFHVFTVEWSPGVIKWYIDGNLYKTETKNPNSLSPASNNAVTWPWDINYYIILNLALGGSYSGDPSSSTISSSNVFPKVMQIDYVKVYKDVSGISISGKSSVLQNETNVSYSVSSASSTSSSTFNWNVTGGTIVNGQGTGTITVNWASASGSVSVATTSTCGDLSATLPVRVEPTNCGVVFEDFENIRASYGIIDGTLTQQVTNPFQTGENGSPLSGKYQRNSSKTYDVLILDNFNPGSASDFKSGAKRFLMDVYSNAAGRAIQFVLENSNSSTSSNYPTGRNSIYQAVTTKGNSWETLEFSLLSIPDPNTADTDINRLTIMFEPNSSKGTIYYFDNLMATFKPKPLTIIGPAAICSTATTQNYSVSNTAGSTYAWSVPSDASISNQTGNTITVDFGTASGNVAVVETNAPGCVGDPNSKSITVGVCTGILSSNNSIAKLNLFPNPVQSVMTLESDFLTTKEITFIIIDAMGKEVKSGKGIPSNNQLIIEVNDLLQGIYFVKINIGEEIYRATFTKY